MSGWGAGPPASAPGSRQVRVGCRLRGHPELWGDENRAGAVINGRASDGTEVAARRQQVVPAEKDQQIGLLRGVEHGLDRGRVLHMTVTWTSGNSASSGARTGLSSSWPRAANSSRYAVSTTTTSKPEASHQACSTTRLALRARDSSNATRSSAGASTGSWTAAVTTGSPPTRGFHPSGTETTGTRERPATLWAIDPVKTRRTLLSARCWSTRLEAPFVRRTRSSTTQPLSISSAVTGTSSPASAAAFVWAPSRVALAVSSMPPYTPA